MQLSRTSYQEDKTVCSNAVSVGVTGMMRCVVDAVQLHVEGDLLKDTIYYKNTASVYSFYHLLLLCFQEHKSVFQSLFLEVRTWAHCMNSSGTYT